MTVMALGGAVVIANVSLYFDLRSSQQSTVNSVLEAQAQAVATGLTITPKKVTYQGNQLRRQTVNGVTVDLAVVTTSQVLAASGEEPLSIRTLTELARFGLRSGRSIWLDITDAQHVPQRVFVMPVSGLDEPVVLVASTSLDQANSSLVRTIVIIALLSGLGVFAGGLTIHRLVGGVLQPVGRIVALAEILGESDLHRRVEVRAPHDELGALVKAFNRMLARLESSFETLRRFTADASHELRAPLSIMATELELGLDQSLATEEYQGVLKALQAEVEHMTEMINRLLLLAQADAGAVQAKYELTDIPDLLHEVGARWLPRAEEEHAELVVAAPDSGVVMADPALIRRIVDNLVENAIRHSPEGGTVRVGAVEADGGWVVTVGDQGEGVPPDEREVIFNRFATRDSARVRGRGSGTGLGLAVSRAFAEAHGGTLKVKERHDSGAEFELWIPGRNGGL